VMDLTFASVSPLVQQANVKSETTLEIQHLLVSPWF